MKTQFKPSLYAVRHIGKTHKANAATNFAKEPACPSHSVTRPVKQCSKIGTKYNEETNTVTLTKN